MNKKTTKHPSRLIDIIFDNLVRGSGVFVLLLMSGIIISLIYQSLPSIKEFGFSFLWSKEWDANNNQFGALVPIFGTLTTSIIALIIAVPVSFGIAIFLTELSPNWLKKPLGIAVELLAAIPSIVYGMWGFFIFRPVFMEYFETPMRDAFADIPFLNVFITGTNEAARTGVGLLAAGIILAIMIIPFISSIIRDVFEQTPILMKEASYGIGCTTWECIRHIVIPHSRNGIIGGIMLGLGRALGETMAVTFVIGNTFYLDSIELFMSGNTITSTLANEFDEAQPGLHTSALMELGLILFFISFVILVCSKLIMFKLNKNGK